MLNRVVEEVIEDGTSQSELLWYIMISTTTTTTTTQQLTNCVAADEDDDDCHIGPGTELLVLCRTDIFT